MSKIIRLLVTMVGCLTLLAISAVDHTQAAEKIPFIGAVYGGTGLFGPSSIVTSPDGKHIYVTSETDDSVTVFNRDEGTGLPHLVEVVRDDLGEVNGLDGASHISLSPDGQYAYVAGFNHSAVAVFSRDSSTGMLTFVEVQKAEPSGVQDLGHVEVIAISPDGKYLYTGSFDGTLVVFSRNVDTGRLTFVEVYRDNHDGIDGISWVRDIAISPDNKHVYTTSFGDRAITVFSRDSVTGKLTQVEMKTQADFGLAAGAVDGEKSVEISPDGQYLYVIATNHIVLVLGRDSATGKLFLVEMHTDGQNGVDGLNQAKMLLVSPDGKHLYVASKGDNGVAVFSRNPTTGVLTFAEVQKDGQNGVDGLAGARALTVSPNGQQLYAIGQSDNALATFSRNETSGVLTFLAVQIDGQDGVNGLRSPVSLTLSPDGKHLYVASFFDDAVAVFKRNRITGNLTFIKAHKNGQDGIIGLDETAWITISGDGKHVYVTTGSHSAATDDLVLLFSRDESSGLLTFIERYKEGEGGIIDGLSNIDQIKVSPDGKNVYVTSFGDRAITVFSRDASTEN